MHCRFKHVWCLLRVMLWLMLLLTYPLPPVPSSRAAFFSPCQVRTGAWSRLTPVRALKCTDIMLAASIAAALAALSVARPAVIGSEASRQALAHIHHTSSPHRRAALHAGLSLLSASLCFPPLAARAATITGDVGRKCTTASTPSATQVLVS